MEVLRTSGLEIAFRRAGDGPPLVLVHGEASDGRFWRPQFDDLDDEFTVVAWDEPGMGSSSDPPAGFGLPDYARCLAALIQSLELGPAHVGGLSWGGTVALELYRHHADLVATLILIDTYAGWKGSLPAEEVRARVDGLRATIAAPDFDPSLPGIFGPDPPPDAVELVEEMGAGVRPASLESQLLVMAEADQRDVLPRVEVPTLLIWGEEDARSPLYVARQFADAIAHAELVVIPGAGHCSTLERPERVNAAIRGFCRTHSPQPAQ